MKKIFEYLWYFLGYDNVEESTATMTPMSMAKIPKNKFFNYVVVN
tara:strand:+ start:148 stop:282 length:135 start_codon:yes stop_codon:yes gene_type:complete